MGNDITYLTVEEVKHIHARAMSSMGWNEAPLRSEGDLASAVAHLSTRHITEEQTSPIKP